jgi:hypothetical protein
MSDDDIKPTGYATLREAIEHEQAKRREQNSTREKLSLPTFGNSEPVGRPPAH